MEGRWCLTPAWELPKAFVQMQIAGHHELVSPEATEPGQETQQMAVVVTTDVEALLVRE